MTICSEPPRRGINAIESGKSAEPKRTGVVFGDRAHGGGEGHPVFPKVLVRRKPFRVPFDPVADCLSPDPEGPPTVLKYGWRELSIRAVGTADLRLVGLKRR